VTIVKTGWLTHAQPPSAEGVKDEYEIGLFKSSA